MPAPADALRTTLRAALILAAFVAIVAANSLVKIGGLSLTPLLTATRSPDVNVRVVSCVALGDLGDPSAVPALERCAADEAGDVRSAAQTALNKIRSSTSASR
ncbi:MAG TPA: HEAT repeat domain-containing protein [Elusimicrobiota bacterium]|nr:HEAT repeat domain-containing protein [Elusimicrobiota bacterium]